MLQETPIQKTVGDVINENRDTILSLKAFDTTRAIPDPLEATKFLCTMGYLIESGAGTLEALLETYRECAETGDYEKLALMNTRFQIRQTEERLKAATEKTSDDPNTPGKMEIAGGLEFLKEALTDIGTIKSEQGKVPFTAIESPSQSVTPLWVKAIQQTGKPITEIWTLLESGNV